MFQRVLYFDNKNTRRLHEKILEKTLLLKESIKVKERNNIYLNLLINKLRELKVWWDKNKNEWYEKLVEIIDEKFTKYLIDEVKKIEEEYIFLEEKEKQKLDAILRRGVNNIRKIILLDGLISDKKICYKNIDKSVNLFKICLKSVENIILEYSGRKVYIEDEEKRDSKLNMMIKLIEKYGQGNTIELSYFNILLREKLDMSSPNTQVKWVGRLEKEELVKIEHGLKNKKMLRLIEKK